MFRLQMVSNAIELMKIDEGQSDEILSERRHIFGSGAIRFGQSFQNHQIPPLVLLTISTIILKRLLYLAIHKKRIKEPYCSLSARRDRVCVYVVNTNKHFSNSNVVTQAFNATK